MAKADACRILRAIKKEVSASIQYSERSQTGNGGQLRRSAAKAIARADHIIERKAPGILSHGQRKKLDRKVYHLQRTLYSGGEPVDNRTIKRTKELLSEVVRMARRTC